MTALAPVAPKLAKLIPLLSSDKDGEVVATARAIERMLRGIGLDLHALAAALAAEPEVKVVVVYRDPPKKAAEPDTWAALATWCRENAHRGLSTKERLFVCDMAHRLICDGEPTEKQAAWLRAIYAKLRKAMSA